MDSDEILEESLKSSIKDIYRVYSDELNFAGYAIGGSAIAASVAVGFGLPIVGAVAGNFGGATLKYVIDRVRDKNFKDNYKLFMDYVTKREVILAPLNKHKGDTARVYKSAIKGIVTDIFSEINKTGELLLTQLDKTIDKTDAAEKAIPLYEMRTGIEMAMKQKLVNKGDGDFIVESPFIVGMITKSFKFVLRLLKKSASAKAKKVLVDLKMCSSKKDKKCIKSSLVKLQTIICKDYMDDFIDDKEFTTITKMILTAYDNNEVGEEFKRII